MRQLLSGGKGSARLHRSACAALVLAVRLCSQWLGQWHLGSQTSSRVPYVLWCPRRCRHIDAVMWACLDAARSMLELMPSGGGLVGDATQFAYVFSCSLTALGHSCPLPLLIASGAHELQARVATVST